MVRREAALAAGNGVLTTGWLYQGQLTPVAELDGTGNVTARFVYATGINVPDYVVKGDSTYRLIRDHLGSVRLVVNVQTGTVAQRVDYDEFGVEIQNTNPGFQPFGYAGGLTEAATGLVRFGMRDYDPLTGRWTMKDPIGFSAGQGSLYAYSFSDPIGYVDPTGLGGIGIQFCAGGVLGWINGKGVAGSACIGVGAFYNSQTREVSIGPFITTGGTVGDGSKGNTTFGLAGSLGVSGFYSNGCSFESILGPFYATDFYGPGFASQMATDGNVDMYSTGPAADLIAGVAEYQTMTRAIGRPIRF